MADECPVPPNVYQSSADHDNLSLVPALSASQALPVCNPGPSGAPDALCLRRSTRQRRPVEQRQRSSVRRPRAPRVARTPPSGSRRLRPTRTKRDAVDSVNGNGSLTGLLHVLRDRPATETEDIDDDSGSVTMTDEAAPSDLPHASSR